MKTATRTFGTEREGDTLILTPRWDLGELEYSRAGPCVAGVFEMLGAAPVRHVVLDLRQTGYLGSSALGFLLKLWKRVRSRQGNVAFCNVSAAAMEIFRVTKLGDVWPIYPSRAEALLAVRERAPGQTLTPRARAGTRADQARVVRKT
jgi:anti-anti-sigma factor